MAHTMGESGEGVFIGLYARISGSTGARKNLSWRQTSEVSKDLTGKMTWRDLRNKQSGDSDDPSARGPSSLFVVWRSGRVISVFGYLLLFLFVGVSMERWRIVGIFIGFAHPYIDRFRYSGGAIFVCVRHIEIFVITLVITSRSFYTNNAMAAGRCFF